MPEFDPHISVETITNARDNSNYTIKEIDIEHKNIKINSPFKVLEGKEINKDSTDYLLKKIDQPIFETGKYISQQRSWYRLHYLLEEAEEDKITGLNKFIGFRKNLLDSSLTTSSLVFAKNPFSDNFFKVGGEIKKLPPLDRDCFDSLLDHIHATSNAFILSPDIRIKKDEIIILDDYLKFVDMNVKILSQWNKKPIFVPIQVHLPQRRLRKILSHYKIQGYTNIWVNFNASHLGGTYLGRVRTLLRTIDDIFGREKVVLYFSHIKKEINPHMNDEKVVSSDILSQFFGADFVGVNREPMRIIKNPDERIEKLISQGEFNSKNEYEDALKRHKSRIFDPESYYYFKLDNYPSELPINQESILKNVGMNKLLNSILIHNEIENTKKVVENEGSISPYLKNKTALNENRIENRRIIDHIISYTKKSKQTNLFEKLGRL